MIPQVIFEDTHLLVVDKPAGLLSQSDISGEPCLVDWARAYVGRNYVGLVHRLDRNTSGLMVLAKRSKSADRLTQALQSGKLVRKYRALVLGRLPQAQVNWQAWLIKDESTNIVKGYKTKDDAPVAIRTSKDLKNAKLVATEKLYFRNTPVGDISEIELELETGRSHQIRVQAALEGTPVLGDPKYGLKHPQSERARRMLARPALHSSFIKFPHPMSGEELSFERDLPHDIRALLK